MYRLFWLVVVLFCPSVVLAQAANPFAGFETITLPNNMKLWYKQLKGDQNASISVSVPFGSNQDPVGKEQLAHFTEHMLFSDHLGKTEEQIKKEVEDLGGDRNAVTYGDRTFYYVRIDRKHALFAIDWLSRIVSPHEMASSVVEKQRIPVAIEIGAQPRQLFDWISATYINPSFLRFPSFWKRDFNIEVPVIDRDYYPYRSLSAITAEDLKAFYNRYYVPSLMTVVVIGDIEREEVLKKVTETFGAFASRPEPQIEDRLKTASKLRESFQWTYNADIFFSKMFRFYKPSKQTYLKGLFVVEILRKRLNERLRFGDKKAAYGIATGMIYNSGGAVLAIQGELNRNELDYARAVIEEEIERLRSGKLTDADFQSERETIIKRLLVTNSTAKDLEKWVSSHFYDPKVWQDFPDIIAVFQSFKKSDIEEFVQQNLSLNRETLLISYIHPIPQTLLLSFSLLVLGLVVVGVRQVLLQPLSLIDLRYMARFRISPLLTLILASVFILALAIIGRLLFYLCQLINHYFLEFIDIYWVQLAAYTLMGAGLAFLLFLCLSLIPRKLIILRDRIIVKYLFYRSTSFGLDQIEEISKVKFADVWLSSLLWKCLPLALGIGKPSLYLRFKNGQKIFFEVRDQNEFMTVLEQLRQEALRG